jgi:hypothetical protein
MDSIVLTWIPKRWKKWSDQNGVLEDAYRDLR